ncbi:unnamed protein product [Protopolystoma xenopodis]|uniref:Uncharacterized protein n=1 Tax=Protopolystoma xenopodis TaxID=117903 RepID=A0A448XRI2_9PLAT|nr:unnamed protein product [Protopolystoma xenopodis]
MSTVRKLAMPPPTHLLYLLYVLHRLLLPDSSSPPPLRLPAIEGSGSRPRADSHRQSALPADGLAHFARLLGGTLLPAGLLGTYEVHNEEDMGKMGRNDILLSPTCDSLEPTNPPTHPPTHTYKHTGMWSGGALGEGNSV